MEKHYVILVVEDDADINKLLCTILTRPCIVGFNAAWLKWRNPAGGTQEDKQYSGYCDVGQRQPGE